MRPAHVLEREQWLPQPPEEVFAFFADPGNLQEITPQWLRFRILISGPIDMRAGTVIEYEIRWHVLPMRWRTVIADWDPPRSFVDVQQKGPYSLWRHTHRLEPHRGGTLMIDRVEYRLPLGPLGRLAHWLTVRRDLERVFDYRKEKIDARFHRKQMVHA